MLRFKFTCVFLFCAALVRAEGGDYNPAEDAEAALTDMKNVTLGLHDKLESEFKFNYPPEDRCPFGFTYLPLARSCYMIIYESHTWESADARCHQSRRGAHLVAIEDPIESNALKSYLQQHFAPNPASSNCGNNLWTSGQRSRQTRCKHPLVWKLSSYEHLKFIFTDWARGEPNCRIFKKEHCVELRGSWGYLWNDEKCKKKMCPLCEYQP